MFFVWFFRKRQENRDLAMQKLKEGNVAAASELFQVDSLLLTLYISNKSVSRTGYSYLCANLCFLICRGE